MAEDGTSALNCLLITSKCVTKLRPIRDFGLKLILAQFNLIGTAALIIGSQLTERFNPLSATVF